MALLLKGWGSGPTSRIHVQVGLNPDTRHSGQRHLRGDQASQPAAALGTYENWHPGTIGTGSPFCEEKDPSRDWHRSGDTRRAWAAQQAPEPPQYICSEKR